MGFQERPGLEQNQPYYVPSIVLATLYVLPHVTITAALWSGYCYPHLREK